MRSEELIEVCRMYETFKTMYFAEPGSAHAVQFDRPTGCWIVSLVEVREAKVLFETMLLNTERRAEAVDMLKAIDTQTLGESADL